MLKNGTKIMVVAALLCVALYIGLFLGRTATADYIIVADVLRSKIISSREESKHYAVDLNTATLEDLIQIPGITHTLAKSIIDYREDYGDYFDIRELKDVYGISDQLYEKIKIYVTVGGS